MGHSCTIGRLLVSLRRYPGRSIVGAMTSSLRVTDSSSLALAAVVLAATSISGSARQDLSSGQPSGIAHCAPARLGLPHGNFWRVAATSPRNAWAVGAVQDARTLIVHWDGKAWQRQPSPSPGGQQGLAVALIGVAATSSHDAWAVGFASGS